MANTVRFLDKYTLVKLNIRYLNREREAARTGTNFTANHRSETYYTKYREPRHGPLCICFHTCKSCHKQMYVHNDKQSS